MLHWGWHCISWSYTRTRMFLYLRNAFGHSKLLISRKLLSKYRKIPKILAPGLIFFKGPFWGTNILREICFSKSIGLAHGWKEIYVSNLQQVFSETRLEDEDLSKNSAMQVLCLYRPRKSKPRLQWTTQTAPWIYWEYTVTRLWHSLTATIWHT